MKKLQQGFTLAELLIALGIVGVLAMITVPIINNMIDNATRDDLMQKKAEHMLDEALYDLITDSELYPDENVGFADTNKVKYKGVEYEGATKLCGLLAAKMGGTECENSTFTTPDGTTWTVPNTNFTNNSDTETITYEAKGKKDTIKKSMEFDRFGKKGKSSADNTYNPDKNSSPENAPNSTKCRDGYTGTVGNCVKPSPDKHTNGNTPNPRETTQNNIDDSSDNGREGPINGREMPCQKTSVRASDHTLVEACK